MTDAHSGGPPPADTAPAPPAESDEGQAPVAEATSTAGLVLYIMAVLTFAAGTMLSVVLFLRDRDAARERGLDLDWITWTQVFTERWLPWAILAAVLFVGAYVADLAQQQRAHLTRRS